MTMTAGNPPSLLQLRVRAMKLGYAIYYPGIYCDTATIYPVLPKPDASAHPIDMTDPIVGLWRLSAELDKLAQEAAQ